MGLGLTMWIIPNWNSGCKTVNRNRCCTISLFIEFSVCSFFFWRLQNWYGHWPVAEAKEITQHFLYKTHTAHTHAVNRLKSIQIFVLSIALMAHTHSNHHIYTYNIMHHHVNIATFNSEREIMACATHLIKTSSQSTNKQSICDANAFSFYFCSITSTCVRCGCCSVVKSGISLRCHRRCALQTHRDKSPGTLILVFRAAMLMFVLECRAISTIKCSREFISAPRARIQYTVVERDKINNNNNKYQPTLCAVL